MQQFLSCCSISRIHTCMAYIRKLFKRFGFSVSLLATASILCIFFLILIIKSSVECYICKNIICSNVYSILITAVCHIYCFLTEESQLRQGHLCYIKHQHASELQNLFHDHSLFCNNQGAHCSSVSSSLSSAPDFL